MTRDHGPDEIILTTCPRDCYDTCGISVLKRNGVVTAVRGNPAHPVSRGTLCGKCSTAYNREWRDPNVRLTRPLRRSGPKGQGQFEPVSWDTALREIADALQGVVAAQGARSILNAHYTGTMSRSIRALRSMPSASWCGVRIRMPPHRMRMNIGCPRRAARSWSSIPFGPLPRRKRTFTSSRSRAATRRWHSACCT